MIKKIFILLWTGWKKLGNAINFVVSRVIISMVYIVAIGAYALIFYLVQILSTQKKQKNKITFWTDKNYREPKKKLEQQF